MHKCEYCGKKFERPVTSGHKRKCPAFLASKPEEDRVPPPCVCRHTSTSLTQMKRHRKTCVVWQSRDKDALALSRIKATFARKYGEGVENPLDVPGAKERKAGTMTERYGASNPFSRESALFDKVQSHWDGKDRAAHLPKDNFARPEIKEKIRQTNVRRYGVENPTKNPEIRSRQLATNLERYGDEQTLRVPELRAKAAQTNLVRRGVLDPMQSDEVKEKVRQTNLGRYGVEWTTQNEGVLAKLRESHLSRFGMWYVQTDSWKNQYSAAFPEAARRYRETCLTRYGAIHPMKNTEYARKHLAHSRRAGPNSIESKFNKLYPFFCFSGDGSFWKLIPSAGKNRNPDFCFPVYPKADGRPSFKAVTHVVEVFGDYWHGEVKTGEPNGVHAQKIMDQWLEAGLKCLVVWEHELVGLDFSELDARVEDFLKA